MVALLALLGPWLYAGCAVDAGPDRAAECVLTAGFRPGAAPGMAKLERLDTPPVIVGSWDGWERPQPGSQGFVERTDDAGNQWQIFRATLPPGTYQYAFLVGNVLAVDELNGRTAFARDPRGLSTDLLTTEVSEIVIPDCAQPRLEVAETRGGPDGVTVTARFVRGVGGPGLDAASLRAIVAQGEQSLGTVPLTVEGALDGAPKLVARATGLAPGKYTLELTAAALDGRTAEPLRAAAFVEPRPGRALSEGLLYQIMIDRFRGAAGPLAAPATEGLRAGGTLDGVRAVVESGYFERLGVTTLWLSPVYTNPDGIFTGRDGHLYESYHGYWPTEPRAVDDKLGGAAALDALVAAAHARGLRVILDVVPNHTFDAHPYYQQHSLKDPAVAAAPPDALTDWFNDGPKACLCGIDNCYWGETCWFDHYLPDLNWRNPEVLATGADDVVWWTRRFDLDGVRIDAVPLMPRAASRRIEHAVKHDVARSGLDSLVIGETFTGPGEEGRALLRTYLGSLLDGLDSEFDFPLMWDARKVIARGEGSLRALEDDLVASARDFGTSGATLAHMIGNHDVSRFVSTANGDGDGDPWLLPPSQPTSEAPYKKQVLALTFMLTLPGLPVLYYGDEVGLAGAGDPDCRRVLPDVLHPETLLPVQQQLLAQVSRLGRLRACMPALGRGTRTPLYADDDHLVSLHTPPTDGEPAIVVLSRATSPTAVDVTGLPRGRYVDALSGRALVVDSDSTHLTADALSAAVYLPETSACVE